MKMVKQVEKGQLVIITGMSGAGKTVAIQSFEDLGYFCVDNLPPTLLPKFLDIMETSTSIYNKVAVVMDLRGRDFFEQLLNVIEDLKASERVALQILFLDADDEALVKRYKETRRAHPLAPNDLPMKGIMQERKLLSHLKNMAKYVFTTTQLKPKELREKISLQFATGDQQRFQVLIISFGYKHGIPIDSDLVFDVRFLPNPFYDEELRSQTGLDEPVSTYVKKWSEYDQFIDKFVSLLDFIVPQYQNEGKAQLVIAIGCTGGQHRSVTIAEELQKHFTPNYTCHVSHRDIQKKKLSLHE